MKILEYGAKEVLRQYRIPTPDGGVVASTQEARAAAERVGGSVAVKAQLPVGGRGKAGGILFADDPDEAADVARSLIGSTIKGVKVKRVLVEEKLVIEDELYVGFVVDRRNRSYVALASSEGGMDIEEVAVTSPEKIVRYAIDPVLGLRIYHARRIAGQLGFAGQRMTELAEIILKLYRVAVDSDAELTEINPLALTKDGFVAADARLNIDANALYRHHDLVERYQEGEFDEFSPRELEARRLGFAYVEMDGNIGIIGNGAGLTMATLDTVMLYGGRPGDFLDLGGGAPTERIGAAALFLLSDPRIDALFVNILGGITRCDDTARGIVEALGWTGSRKPVIVRLVGTNEEEGRRILEEAGVDVFDTMEESAERVVGLAGGK